MIVKITIFFAVILVVCWLCMKVWFNEHPLEAIALQCGKYPIWYLIWCWGVLLEIVLIVVSIFWFLFLR